MTNENQYSYKQVTEADLETLSEVNQRNLGRSQLAVVYTRDGTSIIPKDVLANPTDKRGVLSYCVEQRDFVSSLLDYDKTNDEIEWPEVEL